ncbi:MAG TPA: hypothetical protein VI932_12500 [Bacteroidota bacterium]|nr:hypothetical protein [Bacteroidota bacterium]
MHQKSSLVTLFRMRVDLSFVMMVSELMESPAIYEENIWSQLGDSVRVQGSVHENSEIPPPLSFTPISWPITVEDSVILQRARAT